jgi:hypothetical protein
MQLAHVTFVGPPIDDRELLSCLPENLAALLEQINGFIQYHGGLHLRGVCCEPAWHSLRVAWFGKQAFQYLYSGIIRPDDVPFAEDCMGDQFVLREGKVWRLFAETGELESLRIGYGTFLEKAQADPVEFLGMQPLLQFQSDGGQLEPGQLLAGFPPFCLEESSHAVHLAAVPSDERHRFLANLARKLKDVPDGGKLDFELEE